MDTPTTLAPIHIYNGVGPKFPEGAVFTQPFVNNELYSKSLSQVIGSRGLKQVVSGFGIFISATGTKPSQNSMINYCAPMNQPFTEYSVIKELLKSS